MAKSPISESHVITLTGILMNSETDVLSMEFEELGTRKLSELLERFDGETVSVTVKLKNDITE